MVQAKKKMDQEALQNFEKLADKLLKNKVVPYNFQSEVGFILDRVQQYIQNNNILFVAMGKKLMVSNKETVDELLEQIEVPLVIVPYQIN